MILLNNQLLESDKRKVKYVDLKGEEDFATIGLKIQKPYR